MTTPPSQSSAAAKANPGPSAIMVLLTRIATPLWFAIIALVQIMGGLKTLPQWMVNFSAKWWSIPLTPMLRTIIALELAGICVMLLMGRWARVAAVVLLMGACFVTIAEISGHGLGLETLPAIFVFLISALLLTGVGLREEPGRAPAPSWPAITSTSAGILAAVTLAVLIRLDETLPARTPDTETGAGSAIPQIDPLAGKIPGERVREIDPATLERVYWVDHFSWVNHPVTETNWLGFLPDGLGDKLRVGTHVVVFYNPNHVRSRAFFEDLLLGVPRSTVVAVRVPAVPHAAPADADLGPVACEGCEMLALPYGPIWQIDVPSIFKVVDGIVICWAKDIDELAVEGCLEQNVSPPTQ